MEVMDPKLIDYLEALREEMRAGQEALTGEMQTLRADMAVMGAQVRTIQVNMVAMEQRLIEAINHRRVDIDIIGREVINEKRRLRRLERRVAVLETRDGGGE